MLAEVDRTAPAINADKIATIDFVSVDQAIAVLLVDFQVPETNYANFF